MFSHPNHWFNSPPTMGEYVRRTGRAGSPLARGVPRRGEVSSGIVLYRNDTPALRATPLARGELAMHCPQLRFYVAGLEIILPQSGGVRPKDGRGFVSQPFGKTNTPEYPLRPLRVHFPTGAELIIPLNRGARAHHNSPPGRGGPHTPHTSPPMEGGTA